MSTTQAKASGRAAGRPAGDGPAAARARVAVVTDWIVAREGSSLPGPAAVDGAARILAAPPRSRDVSIAVHPATVWRVGGHLVAVYHFGSRGGPVADAECSCRGEDVCEHLLVALAGTRGVRDHCGARP